MQNVTNASAYLSIVQAAQDLANLLNDSRPELHEQVELLRAIVTRSQLRLDQLYHLGHETTPLNSRLESGSLSHVSISHGIAAALNELEAAYEVLLELNHTNGPKI